MTRRKSGSHPKVSTGGKKPYLSAANAVPESEATAEIVPEDWCFVSSGGYQCSSDEKPYLLEYEYAREAVAYKIQDPSAPTWQQIFGDQFPRMPFLSINAIERRRLLTESFSRGVRKIPLFDSTNTECDLLYRFTYPLNPKYQAQLEAVTEEARENLNLVQPQRSLEAVVSAFTQDLPREAYDESVADVQLTIRFEYSDEKLKEAFAKLLATIRRTKSESTQHIDLDTRLKRLAATRLYRIFGTVEKARSYAFDMGHDNIYADDGGWSRARNEVWQRLGVSVFPPDIPAQSKVA